MVCVCVCVWCVCIYVCVCVWCVCMVCVCGVCVCGVCVCVWCVCMCVCMCVCVCVCVCGVCMCVQECSPGQVADSLSQVLSVQQLLVKSDLVKLFQSFSSLDMGGSGGGDGEGSGDCEDDQQSSGDDGEQCAGGKDDVHFFCGISRSELSPLLGFLLERSKFGDSYRQGNYVL